MLPSEDGIGRCPRGYSADFRPVLLCGNEADASNEIGRPVEDCPSAAYGAAGRTETQAAPRPGGRGAALDRARGKEAKPSAQDRARSNKMVTVSSPGLGVVMAVRHATSVRRSCAASTAAGTARAAGGAAAAAAAGSQLLDASGHAGVFLAEDIECRQADVGHFLLAKKDFVNSRRG
jgi:hypothetical protein